MMIVPYGFMTPPEQPPYPEMWLGTDYFSYTLQSLRHWRESLDEYPNERPSVHTTGRTPMVSVKSYFDHEYEMPKSFGDAHFTEAVELLQQMSDKVGMSGVYSFFKVLSVAAPADEVSDEDRKAFVTCLREVIVPHFEPSRAEERIHGAVTVGHAVGAALTSLVHAPVAVASAARYAQLKMRRSRGRKFPSVEVIDQLMPLLHSMQDISNHAIEVLNAVEPVPGRSLELTAPIQMAALQEAIDHTRYPDHAEITAYARG